MSSSHVPIRDLAAALKRQTIQTGSEAPSVRGSDWRSATVATVNAGTGTVVTTDGIVARRAESYQLPAVGDLIFITQSGDGSWQATTRQTPATGDDWVSLTAFTTPWRAYGGTGGYQVPRCRRAGGEVIMEGLVDSNSVSVSSTVTVLTLPVGYRPASAYVFSASSTNVSRQLNILNTGVVQVVATPAVVFGFLSLNCRFSLI